MTMYPKVPSGCFRAMRYTAKLAFVTFGPTGGGRGGREGIRIAVVKLVAL